MANKKDVAIAANGITINTPAVDAPGSVQRMGDPGPANSLICYVSGEFDYASDYHLDGIRVLAQKRDNGGASTGEPYATDQEEVDAVTQGGIDIPPENIDANAGTWFANASVIGNIDNDPSVTWNHISAVALVSVMNPNAPELPPSSLLAHHQFQATPVDVGACPSMVISAAQMPERELEYKPQQPKGVTPLMLKPIEVIDGWIRYSFFSRSGGRLARPPLHGYQLESPGCCGTPLQARSIAVAAGVVDWRPRIDPNFVVTRPYGILDTSSFDSQIPSNTQWRRMHFEGLPKFSLVVHQLRYRPEGYFLRIPVDSECRDRPLRIVLDPAKPFYVQVNNVVEDRTKSDGTLEFWVKILC